MNDVNPQIFSKESRNAIMQTNWCVITGAMGSINTTTVDFVSARCYKTTIEHGRHYLDTKRSIGKTVEEVRKNKAVFQLGVLEIQVEQDKLLSPGDVVFLDKAIPDYIAYYRFLHPPEDEKLLKALSTVSYKKIFILDFLPLINDYARTEDAVAQKKIHALLTIVYESLPFPVVHVPVLKPEERIEFILKNM